MRLATLSLLVLVGCQVAGADGTPTRTVSTAAIAAAERACNAGDAKECTRAAALNLEVHYDRDRGGNNAEAANRLYERACKLGDVRGCTGVAWAFITARDYTRGLPIAEDSCRRGDQGACTLIADQIAPGAGWALEKGVKEDLARALSLYEAACTAATDGDGCTSGCNSLARIHRHGAPSSSNVRVRPDVTKAIQYYDRACKLGCINSCDTLGDLTSGNDPTRAAVAWQKACDSQFAPACASLSKLYETGRGVTKDPARAKQLWTRACRVSNDQVSGCRP